MAEHAAEAGAVDGCYRGHWALLLTTIVVIASEAEHSSAAMGHNWIAASLVGGWTLPRKVQPRPGDGANPPTLAMTEV